MHGNESTFYVYRIFSFQLIFQFFFSFDRKDIKNIVFSAQNSPHIKCISNCYLFTQNIPTVLGPNTYMLSSSIAVMGKHWKKSIVCNAFELEFRWNKLPINSDSVSIQTVIKIFRCGQFFQFAYWLLLLPFGVWLASDKHPVSILIRN